MQVLAERSELAARSFGLVFLARAVHEIGKAMFPNEWTGRELITPLPRDYRRGSGSRTLSQIEMRALIEGTKEEFDAVCDINS